MKNLLIGFLAVCNLFTVQAQNHCGTTWDQQWAEEMLLKDRSYLNTPRGTRATIYVPIHYHIVRKNDGTGAFPLNYLLQMHCELNERYAPADIQFILDTISYINNTTLYAYTTGGQAFDNNTYNTYNTLNNCNVYLVDDPAGNCGYTYRPMTNGIQKRGGIFVKASRNSQSCSGPGSTTLTHEMGHWLDLPHTFFGWEGVNAPNPNNAAPSKPNGWANTERVARSGANANCSTSGDFLCGTNPDYLSNRWSQCNATSSWANYKDPLGVSFTIEAANYMGYASDNCANKFSADQMNQMRNCFTTKADRIPYTSLTIPPFVDLDSIITVSPANNSKLPKNNVLLTWNAVPDVEMYHLIVLKGGSGLSSNPNFDLYNNVVLDTLISVNQFLMNPSIFSSAISGSNTYYYWKVKPMRKGNSCENYSSAGNFKVSVFNLDYEVRPVSCKGKNDGAIFLKAYGGISTAYTYETDVMGSMIDSNFNLAPSIYNLTVKGTDPLDFITFPIEITEPEEITATFDVKDNKATVNAAGGNGGYTYKWSSGETSSTITFENNKSYTVTITDSKGCSASKSLGLSGVQLVELDAKTFTVYPNPLNNQGFITVDIYAAKEQSATFDLVDLKGNVVQTWNVDLKSGKNVPTLNTGIMPAGIYVLSVTSDNFIGNKKLVVR